MRLRSQPVNIALTTVTSTQIVTGAASKLICVRGREIWEGHCTPQRSGLWKGKEVIWGWSAVQVICSHFMVSWNTTWTEQSKMWIKQCLNSIFKTKQKKGIMSLQTHTRRTTFGYCPRSMWSVEFKQTKSQQGQAEASHTVQVRRSRKSSSFINSLCMIYLH